MNESASVAAQSEPDDDLVQALRRGDEDAFVTLVSRYYSAMLRLAKLYVPSHAVAEEVVQETWLAVLQGICRFEGRSSLKTWMFRILVNIAKTRVQCAGRSVPLSSLAEHELWPHHWLHAPQSWAVLPEEKLLS